jgi:pyridoxine 5''-phosphate synthase
MHEYVKLGVNIDHVATIRNARGGAHPDPVRAAEAAIRAGADLITVHLREDRRHIRDDDVRRLSQLSGMPINLEVGATPAMADLARMFRPQSVCFVPERRAERTTEGGLDAKANWEFLAAATAALRTEGITITLFLEPDAAQIDAAKEIGADAVEIHTGRYCDATGAERDAELRRIAAAAARLVSLDLECHAGHGLNYENVGAIAAIDEVVELNIGHFMIGEAIFTGLDRVVAEMRSQIAAARRRPGG